MLWLMVLLLTQQKKTLSDTDLIEQKLTNGTQVTVVIRPKIPCAVAGLWLKVGSSADEQGREGTAHLLEHLIPATRFGREDTVQVSIERMGGMLIAETGRNFMSFQIVMPAQELSKGFPLLVQSICNPAIDLETVNREKELISLEILAKYEEPFWVTKMALESQLLNGMPELHPPGGWLDTIPCITPDDVKRFHLKHFIAPNFTLVAIVPDDKVLPELTESLKMLPQGSVSEQAIKERYVSSEHFSRHASFHLRHNEALWGMGWCIKIEKWEEVIIWDALMLYFQNTVAPSIFKQVGAVEDWTFASDPIKGKISLTVTAKLRPFTDMPKRLFQQSLQKLAEHPISDETLNQLRERLRLQHRWIASSPLGLAQKIGWSWAFYDNPSLPLRYEQILDELTSEKLQAIASQLNETKPIFLSFQH